MRRDITIEEALNLLNLEHPYNLAQLKDAYHREIKRWHPDLNPKKGEKGLEKCKRLNVAYDFLEAATHVKVDGKTWYKWMERKLPEWERDFKQRWQLAYRKSCLGGVDAGLHFNTCIENFRRGAIEPRPEWFLNCLMEDTPMNRVAYREHLMKIVPTRRFKNDWARKYFALEFGEGQWVFYLPASKELLNSSR